MNYQQDRRPRAEVSVTVGGTTLGPFALPRHSPAGVGRAPGCAIRLEPDWAPRRLATFAPVDDGWLLRNGERTRLTAASRTLRHGVFERGAVVFLQAGRWSLAWDLDGACTAEVRITSVPREASEQLPWALDDTARDDGAGVIVRTAVAGARMPLSPRTRHRLAVLFAHELDGTTPPENLCRAAGRRLDLAEAQVKRTALRVRDRLNARREHPLQSLEELGYYLVHVSGAIGPDDLDP